MCFPISCSRKDGVFVVCVRFFRSMVSRAGGEHPALQKMADNWAASHLVGQRWGGGSVGKGIFF